MPVTRENNFFTHIWHFFTKLTYFGIFSQISRILPVLLGILVNFQTFPRDTGKCQKKKVLELESVRIGKCQNWKVL